MSIRTYQRDKYIKVWLTRGVLAGPLCLNEFQKILKNFLSLLRFQRRVDQIDNWGRPVGQPHNCRNPPIGLIKNLKVYFYIIIEVNSLKHHIGHIEVIREVTPVTSYRVQRDIHKLYMNMEG